MKRLATLFLLSLALPLSAQTWFKVADESQSSTLTLPAGTTYRFGAVTCWSASATVTDETTFSPVYYTSFPFADPCPNITKEVDVLEGPSAQTVTLNQAAVAVPALPTPTPSCPAGTYAEIAGGTANETANVPPGTVYRTDPNPAATCTTAAQQTVVDISAANLYVLETNAIQLIPITLNGLVNNVTVAPLSSGVSSNAVAALVSITLTLNGKLMTCTPSTAIPGTMNCTYN